MRESQIAIEQCTLPGSSFPFQTKPVEWLILNKSSWKEISILYWHHTLRWLKTVAQRWESSLGSDGVGVGVELPLLLGVRLGLRPKAWRLVAFKEGYSGETCHFVYYYFIKMERIHLDGLSPPSFTPRPWLRWVMRWCWPSGWWWRMRSV